jgi:hypothetical protein
MAAAKTAKRSRGKAKPPARQRERAPKHAPENHAEDVHDAAAFVPNSPAPRLRGRATVLTDELERALVRKLECGTFVEQACAEVGLARPTFYSWMKRGRTPTEGRPNPAFEQRCEEFAANVDAARARAQGMMQRVLFAKGIGGSADGGDPEATLDARAAEAYLRTLDAQQIAVERSAKAKLEREKMREEINQLRAGGRTNAQVRRDAEQRTAEEILKALATVLNEEQYAHVLGVIAGSVGGEDAIEGEPEAGRGSARSAGDREEAAHGSGEGEASGR